MRTLFHTSTIAALFMGAATTSFAQMMPEADAITCGEFSSLTVEDQEIAVANIEVAKMEMVETTDADMISDTETEAEMETDMDMDADTDTAMTTETDPEIEASPPVQDLMAACEGNDDMLAIDAMQL